MAFAALAALAAPLAGAAPTVVGQSALPPNVECPIGTSNTTSVQTGVNAGASYEVSSAGTLTSWSFHFGNVTMPGLVFKVLHFTGTTNQYKVLAESAAGAEQANTTETYPIAIPVGPGDLIGYYAGGAGGSCLRETGLSGDNLSYTTGDVAPNSTGVFTPTGGYLLPVSATLQHPPTISSLTPSSGSPAGGAQVTIQGEEFTGATGVTFGGAPVAFSVDSDGQIRTAAPAGPLGTVNVQVTTPAGQSASSPASQFTYANPPSPPAGKKRTGKRARALKKCRKKHGKAKRRCVRRARKLPV
jgi:IPT/TIG domain